MASAQVAVPAIAMRVVPVGPRRLAIHPNTIPPIGRPQSITMMIHAPVDAAPGPAATTTNRGQGGHRQNEVDVVDPGAHHTGSTRRIPR